MPAYFWNGLQHALAGFAFAWAFFALTNTLKMPAAATDLAASPVAEPRPGSRVWFWLALTMGSSAFFFLPMHVDHPGTWIDRLWQFIHYPVPDWDILLLGMDWHRWFLTHSTLLPFMGVALTFEHRPWRPAGYGLAIGMASHLTWDAITQHALTPIVFLPDMLVLRGDGARIWLLVNAAIAFGFTVATAHQFPLAASKP